MAKTRNITKKEAKQLEATSEMQVSAGRYANHIQVTVQEEEFVLDFLARAGDTAVHVARVFVSPTHAERLLRLLKRQIERHKRAFAESPLRRRSSRGKAKPKR
jgi:hypothetical protein